jgi:biopolymer transport protein ExbB/biopolymer transport protein TolQ
MLIERLLKVALLGSSWGLYLLLGLSVLSFSTMAERWIFFRRRSDDLDRLRTDLGNKLEDGDYDGARSLLQKSPSFEARIASEALRWAPCGADAIRDIVESELARVKKEVERGLNLLGTLGNNAPFIGLFGTVLGVIIAFHQLGATGGNTSAMGGVMAGIAEALVATGVGLFVALPAVVAYNLIQKRIGDIEVDAIALTKLLTAHLKANPKLAERALEADHRAPAAESEGPRDEEPAGAVTAA